LELCVYKQCEELRTDDEYLGGGWMSRTTMSIEALALLEHYRREGDEVCASVGSDMLQNNHDGIWAVDSMKRKTRGEDGELVGLTWNSQETRATTVLA
jgi:hypothetical protein